jgi:hypothetical protein
MTATMTVLHHTKLGHVLAAVWRSDPAAAALSAADLAGDDGFPLRPPDSPGAAVRIPVAELKATAIDLNQSILMDPTWYGLVDEQPSQFADAGQAIKIDTPNAGEITVEAEWQGPPAPAVGTKVRVYVQGSGLPEEFELAVDPNAPAVVKGSTMLTLLEGHYAISVLVPGFRPHVELVEVK